MIASIGAMHTPELRRITAVCVTVTCLFIEGCTIHNLYEERQERDSQYVTKGNHEIVPKLHVDYISFDIECMFVDITTNNFVGIATYHFDVEDDADFMQQFMACRMPLPTNIIANIADLRKNIRLKIDWIAGKRVFWVDSSSIGFDSEGQNYGVNVTKLSGLMDTLREKNEAKPFPSLDLIKLLPETTQPLRPVPGMEY